VTQREYDLMGSSDIALIAEYDMNTKVAKKLSLDLGTNPRFVHAGANGYVIESKNKLLLFDWNFQLVKEFPNAVFLGSSFYHHEKERVTILIGEDINSLCQVTIYDGISSKEVNLDVSCSNAQRLNVRSEYIYFVTASKLYKFDSTTSTFSLVPLTTFDEIVKYIDKDLVYRANHVYALELSKNWTTVFNKNMDITQSTNAQFVFQVGETYYLAEKPNSNDKFIYSFEKIEILEIEEDFSYTLVDHNHLILHTANCTFINCQNVYKNGIERVLTDVSYFRAINSDNAIYIDNKSSNSYDVMHINLQTNETKKIMSLNYNSETNINAYPHYISTNNQFTIHDEET
ncbi:MAG: hypothetical protein Q7I99_02305, partial [Acholeplasmataceae bacterium]|nr:hypothetical protein [Acholeplasmataceae bacterium]